MPRRSPCLASIPLAALLLAACGEDPSAPETPVDGGLSRTDASDEDAGQPSDAAVPADGGGVPATHLWGLDFRVPAIVRVDLETLDREEVVHFDAPCADLQCPVFALDSVNEDVYYTGLDLLELHKKNWVSGEEERVWTAPSPIYSLQVSANQGIVYVMVRDPQPTPADSETLYRVDLASGAAEIGLEVALPPFRIDVERGLFWEARDGALWRTRLSDQIPIQAAGDKFTAVNELELGPNGSILTLGRDQRTIEMFDHHARNPRVLVEDAAGPAVSALFVTADPASERLAWMRYYPKEELPRIVYRERSDLGAVELAIPFMFDLRFQSIPDAALPDPPEASTPRPAGSIEFAPCNDAPELECGQLEVAIDRQNAAKGLITLPVRRRRAMNEEQRRGVIVYDYGGPASSYVAEFTRDRFDDGLAGSGTALVDRFDLIAIERRGIDPSNPRFACVPAQPSFPHHMEEADWTRAFAWWSSAHLECIDHPLLNNLSSVDLAMDFDALREALGEDQLNLVTWSYGTTAGATYAKLYPEHTRAIALISPTRPVQDSEDRVRVRSALENKAFLDFFEWCALEAEACPLSSGTATALEVQLRFDSFLTELEVAPIRIGSSFFGKEAVLSLFSVRNWFACVNWRQSALMVAQAAAGDRSLLIAALSARVRAGELPSFAYGDWSDSGAGELSIFLGVHGADRPFAPGFDALAARALTEEMELAHPYFGNRLGLLTGALAGWPATSAPGLVIGAVTAPPLLVVASRFDYATNYEFGQEMIDILDNNSHLVTFDGHLHSAAGFDACTGGLVTDYLLNPAAAPARTSCAEPPVTFWP